MPPSCTLNLASRSRGGFECQEQLCEQERVIASRPQQQAVGRRCQVHIDMHVAARLGEHQLLERLAHSRTAVTHEDRITVALLPHVQVAAAKSGKHLVLLDRSERLISP